MTFACSTFLSALFLCYLLSCVLTVDRFCEIRPNGTGYSHLETNCTSAGYPELASRDLLPGNVFQYSVHTGNEVRLTCAKCSQPLQNVTWRKLADKIVILKSGIHCNDSDLIIPDFKGTDQGNYVCSAMCGNKPISDQWKSVWIRPMTCRRPLCYPRVSLSAKIENSMVGQIDKSLTLSCLVEYDVNGAVFEFDFSAMWIHGRAYGNVVPALNLCNSCFGSRFSCDIWQDKAKGQEWVNLTIRNLMRDDEGWYSCVAQKLTDAKPDANVYYYVSVSIHETSDGHSNRKLLVVAFTVLLVVVTLVSAIVLTFICWKRRENGRSSASHFPPRNLSKSIYISYAEDTPTHLAYVKSMSSDLSKSFNCRLYNEHRNEAAHMFVPNWLSQQISEASCVIVIGSLRYRRLVEETQNASNQPGNDPRREINDWEQRVRYEWNLIQSRGFTHVESLSFCVTVLWDESDESEIPFPLATSKRFRFPSEMSRLLAYLESEGLKCEANEGEGDVEIELEKEDEKMGVNGLDCVSFKAGKLIFEGGDELKV